MALDRLKWNLIKVDICFVVCKHIAHCENYANSLKEVDIKYNIAVFMLISY